MLCGYIMLEPNEARAMLFFGKYKGSFTKTGLWWVNPFITARKVSLRALNMDIDPIKVNDKGGNPIMIGLVLVWRIKDIYKSSFEIDTKAVSFVRVQSDAALREVAGQYNYDINTSGDNEITLRSGGNDVNDQLEIKLNERLEIAGIEVIEARINYLAYAPEIAAVMLRRQQADAIIAAREKIVEGAVSMVKMALDKIANEEVVHFNEEKKAAMVSNLLVVLCADESTQPVINTGTH
jgi:regulator of protease activity HflC (stomatin/prohibitin superfamily)